MKGLSRTKTTPVPVVRTTRMHDLRILTSLPAGKMVPLAVVPLLREDSVTRCTMNLSFEMHETVEILMNAINVNVKAYLVPNLAFERFTGMDDLNRSYEGQPIRDGISENVPYIEHTPAPWLHGQNEILTYLGKHYRVGQPVNLAYIEAYNSIWNFRAKNRSPDIQLRERLNINLAPAFWQHTAFAHIVPDFDQAVIDGEVALNITSGGRMPVKGIGLSGTANTPAALTVRDTEGENTTYANAYLIHGPTHADSNGMSKLAIRSDEGGYPDVWAELADSGISVSLSNIEAARRTQAFAKLRMQYHGHSDDYIIDLLMDGISVPEQAFKQPILLADKNTVFGMAKRYATDAGNLTASVVNGGANISLSMSVPRVPTGGLIMLVAEITPEQLFERQRDPYLHLTSVDELPQFVRDTLDPEKVDVVPNEYVDVDHDTPDATFGYAPLNHAWNHAGPQIGGRFYRPEVDAGFDEDRQRIWAVETQNPTLSEDFYLCTAMHTKPFAVQNQDPFDVVVRGGAFIQGNTVFGGLLIEANDDYDKIEAQVPRERVQKP